jgi:hypothetical protein
MRKTRQLPDCASFGGSLILDGSEAPENLNAFTASESNVNASDRSAFAHVAEAESRSRSQMPEQLGGARCDLARIDENGRVHALDDWNAIFRLHEHQIPVPKTVRAKASQRRAGAVASKEIRSKGLQSSAPTEGIQHVKRHIGTAVGARDKPVKRQTLPVFEARYSLLDVSFPQMEIVLSRIAITKGFDGDLIGAAISIRLVTFRVWRRVGVNQLDKPAISAECRFADEGRERAGGEALFDRG